MSETQLDIRNKKDLQIAINSADFILNKSYLSVLNNENVNIIPNDRDVTSKEFLSDLNNHVRFFDITQVVLNKNENMRDKLISVFNSISNINASLLFLIQGTADKVSIKVGVKVINSDITPMAGDLLENTFRGNFPGTVLSKAVKKDDLQSKILDGFPVNGFVSAVTDVPGVRSENESKDRLYMQGIEKLIDTMNGKTYTMLLIADPIPLEDLSASRRSLENLYSTLVPFSESQFTTGENDTDTISNSISRGSTESINYSITNSVSHTVGKSSSISDSKTKGHTINGGAVGKLAGGGIGAIIGTALLPGLGTVIGAGLGGMAGSLVGGVVNTNSSKTHSETTGESSSDTTGKNTTEGQSSSTSTNETEGSSHSEGKNRSIQLKYENHAVKRIMNKIDETLKRYDTCADIGMWNCSMYCISDSEYVSHMAASVYQSIIRGKNSSLETGAITVWDKDKSALIMKSLKQMEHPELNLGNLIVTPGTLVSSSELAIQAGLPNHSVPGIPVLECAEFGRTVATYGNKILDSTSQYVVHLGKIFHMNKEENLPVLLNPDSLASHTFITGSTGSGKSNTVYQIISELLKLGKKFLIIEPAKGEYKNVFGGKDDVTVYGCIPNLTNILRINPFSFPKGIHVLEHLDRLVEIFNVCWPMYAAMPAVLKEAIEKSYEECGWNLTDSVNIYGDDLYPNFSDVTRNIRSIIDASDYDTDNKGAYKGSLITRLKSLTNGIYGQIFVNNEISMNNLFDENVIIDLSRVGSTETKALIMGLLVLKMQEYRMMEGAMNSVLTHVTVLEEAHNLLKRTSTEQSSESGNLIGKSVEMLTNSIAEMRTYGEGFIIADQAPGLLDLAVIRNTNTKIIMRLPNKEDRDLVGKAANLNDEQIKELAKLPCGVAAVYQNEWVQSVLCKVNHYESSNPYNFKSESQNKIVNPIDKCLYISKLLCNGTKLPKSQVDDLLSGVYLNSSMNVKIRKYFEEPLNSPRFTNISPVVAELLPDIYENFTKTYERTSDVEIWTDSIDSGIKKIDENIEIEDLRNIRQCIITQYVYNELSNISAYQEWRDGGVK